jgi:3D (Asp-Asp-Asp) domain-containing protein
MRARVKKLIKRLIRKNSRLRRDIFFYIKLFCLFVSLLIILNRPYQIKHYGYKVTFSGVVDATAYNSIEWQTDSTPWITALGTRCREGVIAANFLPFGTKVLIDGFGDQVFVVEDRMNKRYKKRIDIWMKEYNDAIKFGRQKIKFYVIET